jgi:Flp pilus assembly protein TadD
MHNPAGHQDRFRRPAREAAAGHRSLRGAGGVPEPRSLPAAALVLVAATAIAFSPVLRATFINIDDPGYVTANAHVLAGLSPQALLWAFTSFDAANWHPLTWVSHLTDISLFGLQAGAHHGMSLAIHILAAISVLVALERMTGWLWPSFLAAALFALHPLRVESVAWISERKDVLSALLWMQTLLAYLRYVKRPGPGRFFAVLAVFALGLMAKPTLVTLPLALLLLDWWPFGRFQQRPPAAASAGTAVRRLVFEKVPLLLLSAVSSVLTYRAQNQGGALLFSEHVPPAAKVGNAIVSYVDYLGMTVWPLHLIPFYPHPGATLSRVAIALSLALLVAVTVGCWTSRRRHPWLLLGWFWYLGTLVPMIGLVQVGLQGMADRYTYVPGLGLAIALSGEAASRVAPGARGRLVLKAGALGLLATLAMLTWRQANFWRDTGALLEHTITVDPRNYFAFNMLGANYLTQGDAEKALPLFSKSLELRPEYLAARYNLGLTLAASGRKDEALAQFAAVLRFNPKDAESRYNRGKLLLEKGDAAAALGDFDAALAEAPDEPALRQARAQALEALTRAAPR